VSGSNASAVSRWHSSTSGRRHLRAGDRFEGAGEQTIARSADRYVNAGPRALRRHARPSGPDAIKSAVKLGDVAQATDQRA
jgi:hypothetical protein